MLQKYFTRHILFLLMIFCQIIHAGLEITSQSRDFKGKATEIEAVATNNGKEVGRIKYYYFFQVWNSVVIRRESVLNGENPGIGYIDAITVKKAFQRKGYGSQLLASAIKDLDKHRLKIVTEIKKNDTARAKFFEKNGFKATVNESETHKEYARPARELSHEEKLKHLLNNF